MHDLLSRTQFSSKHGWRCAPDFVEAPSQFLEFWCWIPERLKAMSKHYSYLSLACKDAWFASNPAETVQPPETLPDEMIAGLVGTKHINEVIGTLWQLARSVWDIRINNQPSHEALAELSISAVYYGSIKTLTGLDLPEGEGDVGHGYVGTNHYIQAMAAGHYAYLL